MKKVILGIVFLATLLATSAVAHPALAAGGLALGILVVNHRRHSRKGYI